MPPDTYTPLKAFQWITEEHLAHFYSISVQEPSCSTVKIPQLVPLGTPGTLPTLKQSISPDNSLASISFLLFWQCPADMMRKQQTVFKESAAIITALNGLLLTAPILPLYPTSVITSSESGYLSVPEMNALEKQCKMLDGGQGTGFFSNGRRREARDSA